MKQQLWRSLARRGRFAQRQTGGPASRVRPSYHLNAWALSVDQDLDRVVTIVHEAVITKYESFDAPVSAMRQFSAAQLARRPLRALPHGDERAPSSEDTS
jgi:hypothetical protein